MVTRDDDKKIYDRISRIRTTIDLNNNTLTTLVQMNRTELERYVKLGSPFMESVAEEGVILHDNGFFEKVRKDLAFKGRKDPKVSQTASGTRRTRGRGF